MYLEEKCAGEVAASNGATVQSTSQQTNSTAFPIPNPSIRLCSGIGQCHTNEPDPTNRDKTLRPYKTVSCHDIRQLVDSPQSCEKPIAQWFIPSTLLSRKFKRQETDGQYWALWADLDKTPPPLWILAGMLAEVLEGCQYETYNTSSATIENPKCRVLVFLDKPLSGRDWGYCQTILNDRLADFGIVPDRANERYAQLCYLPNRGELYDHRSNRTGPVFDPLTAWADKIDERRVEASRKKERAEEAKRDAAARKFIKRSDHPTLIDAFNSTYSVNDILLEANYAQNPRDPNAFRHPASESGSFSASVKDGRVHSLSPRDPLHSDGGGAHDAFSAFKVLFADDDHSTALRLAGDEWVTVDGRAWNEAEGSAPVFPNLDHQSDDIEMQWDQLTLNREDVEKMANAEFLIPNMIVRGHLTLFAAPANGGKTTIFIHLCEELCRMGLDVIYINVDAAPADLKRHYQQAEQYGYRVVSPDAKAGMRIDDVLKLIKQMAGADRQFDDKVLIFDTLKKFVDVINKKCAKEFYAKLRSINVKGATICLLGHTNKYADENGKSMYEGTGDLRNDMDDLIYLDPFKDEQSNCLVVTTRPDKVRANFEQRTFRIHPDRSVEELDRPVNVLNKEDREIIDLAKLAIQSGHKSQKEIIEYVEAHSTYGQKKIRGVLLYQSNQPNGEIQSKKTGRGKDLEYSTIDPSSMFPPTETAQ
jgi:hypothetical protein